MACSLLSIPALDECSFVEREKHKIDISFEGTVHSIAEGDNFSKVEFRHTHKLKEFTMTVPILTFTVYSEIRHIFHIGQSYRVITYHDGSADFELLENGE